MKKYVLPVAASVVAGVVLLGACSDQTNRPEDLSGPVTDKQVEKCETLSMEAVGFEGKSAGSSGGKGGSKGGNKSGGGKVNTKKPGKSSGSKTEKPKNKKPKSCSTEYELFINTKDG